MYDLIVHSDLEYLAVLTIATAYIVVFKKTATEQQKQKCRDDITQGSEYLTPRLRSNPAYRTSAMVIGGKVTHEYGTVLNGFAAQIAPETFQLLSNSITDDSAIAYIGLYILWTWTATLTGIFRTRWRDDHPIKEKMPYSQVTSNERAQCKEVFIVKCT